MKKAFPLLALLGLCSTLYAADACSNPRTSYDRTYCAAKLFIESDKELNEVYGQLKSMLNADLKKSLTTVQRSWIQYRDAQCESNGTINVSCNHEVNVARINYLRERIRECKTGQTNAKLISEASW